MDVNSTLTLRTGREMPVMGLGTWMLTRDTAGTVEQALAMGYRMIDTSSDYGTQPGVGDAMRRTDLPRAEIYLVTKVEEDDDAYERTLRNLDELGQEFVDLMLIHRPPDRGAGEELWHAMIRARADGLVRDIGVSNYSIDEMTRLIDATGEVPAVNQIEWTPFGWSSEMLDFCRDRQIVIQAYSPLTRATRLDDPTLKEISRRHGKTAAQSLIRWNLDRGVVPIPKANRRDHLAENLDVFDFQLDDDEVERLDDLNELASSLGETVAYR